MGMLRCITGCRKSRQSLTPPCRQEAWGHIIAQLFKELPDTIDVPELLVEKGRVLDNFYVPSRDPNGHSAGAPYEHYGPLQSEVAIQHAREIIEFVRAQMTEYTNRLDFGHELKIASSQLC